MKVDLGRLGALLALALLLPACGIGGGGTLTPTVAPGIPSDVKSRAGNRSVTIDWTASAAGAQYVVLRSLVPNGPFFPVSIPAQFRTPTTYVDIGLLNGTTYYYEVVASNAFGLSGPSAVASSTPGFKASGVAAGGSDILAVLPDGSVWEWGQAHGGSISDVPVQVPNLFEMTSVSVNQNHNLALGSDGRVWGWGLDTSGQIGTGGPGGGVVPVPVQMINITDAIAIAAGEQHSLVLTHDGKVWACGATAYGLGTGSPVQSTTPQPVPGLTDIIAIAAGSAQSLALRSDGLVFSWGVNGYGQLGNPPVSSTPIGPTLVSGLTGVVAIAAGVYHSLALRNDGTIYAWGGNTQGQLGIGSTSAAVSTPTKTLNLTGMVALDGGGGHSVAVRNDGTVWSWGYNGNGQLGNGTSGGTPVSTPVQVLNMTSAVAVTASGYNSVALASDGTVFSWGDNVNGGLGNGTGVVAQIPLELPNFTGATSVAAGNGFSLVSKSTGTVWGLGTNTTGQMGNGTSSPTVPVSVPVQSSGITTATAVAAGDTHGLALLSTGSVVAWGSGTFAQIGDGSSGVNRLSPVTVALPGNIIGIASGEVHSFAIQKDVTNNPALNTVYSWGYNVQGQLGLGMFGGLHPTPAPIPSFPGVVSIAAGDRHTIALKSDGTVWVWGSNDVSQLGLGPSANLSSPTQVLGISGAIAVGAGLFHSLVVNGDGTVLAWGQGDYGQLGNGLTSNSDVPVQVANLTGVTAVAGGVLHSLALKSDGTVWAWGRSGSGQLGNPVADHSAVPVPVLELSGVTAISARMDHNVARLSNGTVRSWGSNFYNQLGVPYVQMSTVPVVVQ